jgi:D-alanine--D-alanine ligase
MPRQRLVVLFGGTSSEHEVSLRSARSVLDAVDLDRFEPIPVAIRRDRGWRTGTPDEELANIVASGTEITDLRALAPDLVFPVLHGPNGEDGTIQGLLEILGLPYVGSGVLASAICMDKAICKRVVARAAPEIPLVPWIEIDMRTADLDETIERVGDELGWPCFSKPANLGSSVGVAKCPDANALRQAIELAARYDHKVIIEQAIDAREIELAVLGNGDAGTRVSQPGEIVLPEGTWYDYETKYIKDVARYDIPAQLTPHVTEIICAHALQAFRVLECSGLARVDFLLDRRSGTAYLNEPNTMPGFTSISMYPKLMAASGVSYRELVTRLCDLGLSRHAARAQLSHERDA